MKRTNALFQGFVKASPHVHRAKKCCPRVALFPSSPRESSLKAHARRRFCGVLGLQTIQDPGQNASAHLPQQRAKFPLKFRHLLGRRLVVEELIQQTHPMGE
jgi:hypothetical protein